MGAGSPTYATKQLRGSLAWDIIRARNRLGAALVFASAATIAVSAYMIPVYEIFKFGEDITCPPGLDLFGDLGMKVSLIPHWNNSDGGKDVDTCRCFIGRDRFLRWYALLPPDHIVLGLDEHTGIIINNAADDIRIIGTNTVVILRDGNQGVFTTNSSINFKDLGNIQYPDKAEKGIPKKVWDIIFDAGRDIPDVFPEEVAVLVEKRKVAREFKNWNESDLLREEIRQLGWNIKDTADGQEVERID